MFPTTFGHFQRTLGQNVLKFAICGVFFRLTNEYFKTISFSKLVYLFIYYTYIRKNIIGIYFYSAGLWNFLKALAVVRSN